MKRGSFEIKQEINDLKDERFWEGIEMEPPTIGERELQDELFELGKPIYNNDELDKCGGNW